MALVIDMITLFVGIIPYMGPQFDEPLSLKKFSKPLMA